MATLSLIPLESHAVLRLCRNEKIDIGYNGLSTATFVCTCIHWPIMEFFQNLSTIFLGLLYCGIILVVESFFKMRIHRPERFHFYWVFIVSTNLVVTGKVPTASTFPVLRFKEHRGNIERRRPLLIRFISSSDDVSAGSGDITVKRNGEGANYYCFDLCCSLVIKVSLVGDGILHMMLYQMSSIHNK